MFGLGIFLFFFFSRFFRVWVLFRVSICLLRVLLNIFFIQWDQFDCFVVVEILDVVEIRFRQRFWFCFFDIFIFGSWRRIRLRFLIIIFDFIQRELSLECGLRFSLVFGVFISLLCISFIQRVFNLDLGFNSICFKFFIIGVICLFGILFDIILFLFKVGGFGVLRLLYFMFNFELESLFIINFVGF